MADKPIGTITAGSMIAFAIGVDGAVMLFNISYLLPAVGWAIALVAGIFFNTLGGIFLSAWCAYLGVPFVSRMGVAAIVELIPILNTLPAWTVATIWTVMSANGVGFGRALNFVGLGIGTGVVAKAAAGKKVAGQAALRGAATAPPEVQSGMREGGGATRRTAPDIAAARLPAANDNVPHAEPHLSAANDNRMRREASTPNDGLLVRKTG